MRRLLPIAKSTVNAELGGFALVVVIWGIGLLAVIAATLTTTMSFNARATANMAENARAEALADGAVSIVVADIVNNLYSSRDGAVTRFGIDGRATLCRFGNAALARVAAQDEGGKIDLNAAPPQLLRALFAGLGTGDDKAAALTAAILDYRDDDDAERPRGAEAASYRRAGLAPGPKNGRFETIAELQQVLGVTRELYGAVEPHVTVDSSRVGIDPRAVAPELAAILRRAAGAGGDTQAGKPANLAIPARFATRSRQTSFSITVEVATATGGRFVRHAVFKLLASHTGAHTFTTWERRHYRTLSSGPADLAAYPPC